MSVRDRDSEVAVDKGAGASAPSEAEITTPTRRSSEPQDAVAASGVTPFRRTLRRGMQSSPAYMTLVLVVVFVVFSILSPHSFPTIGNVRNLIVDTAIFLVMAVGMTYVMVAAGFDLSIGSVLVFAGICAAKTMSWVGGQGYWTAFAGLIAALVGGVAWGLFNGFCVTKLRVPALITTLGTLGAALGVSALVSRDAMRRQDGAQLEISNEVHGLRNTELGG